MRRTFRSIRRRLGSGLAGMIEDARPRLDRDLERSGTEASAITRGRWSGSMTSAVRSAMNPTPTRISCVGPDDLAYAIFTSGSTGKPKAALLLHRGLSNLSEAQVDVFGLGPDDRAFSSPRSAFDASIFEIVMPLRVGATLVVAGQSAVMPGPDLVSLIRRERLTTVLLPPSVLGLLPHAELPELHTIIVAGEACPASLVSQWAPGRRFFNAYGPTETTVWASTARCYPDGKPPSIGRPIANTRLLVLDEADAAPPGRSPRRAVHRRTGRCPGLSEPAGSDAGALHSQSVWQGRRRCGALQDGRSGQVAN